MRISICKDDGEVFAIHDLKGGDLESLDARMQAAELAPRVGGGLNFDDGRADAVLTDIRAAISAERDSA